MDTALRNAFVLSIGIHAAVILPLCNTTILQHLRQKDHIVVDYVVVKEPEAKPVPVVRARATRASAETPRVEVKKKVETKAATDTRADIPAKTKTAKEIAQENAQKQAQIKSTQDYISYYQLIREKIRQRLKANYRTSYNEGEVNLLFALRADGGLIAIEVEADKSSTDRKLQGVAIMSVREASPFPAFPKALSLPRMSFNLTVSFKKE